MRGVATQSVVDSVGGPAFLVKKAGFGTPPMAGQDPGQEVVWN
jgi:hypothetical protein